MPTYTILILAIIIIFVWMFLIFKFSKKSSKISSQKKAYFNKILKRTIVNKSHKEQIIDLDKLLHKILQEIWYVWTFWEILKQKPKEVINLNRIWEYHKLRNKLVHDFDLMTENILKKKALEYQKEIKKVLSKI